MTAQGKATDAEILGVRFPRWAALAAALVLLAAIILGGFYALGRMGASRQQVPGGDIGGISGANLSGEYSESPLIAEYDVDSAPVLVFGCNAAREGTWAQREAEGGIPGGTERQDIVNEVCMITGKDAFCNESAEQAFAGSVVDAGHDACPQASGALKIIVFHNPSCSACSSQRAVLGEFKAEFGSEIELYFVCTPFTEYDSQLCARGIISGEFEE